MRDAVGAGRVRNVVLRGVTPDGFLVEADYEADTGMLVPAVLVTRAGTEKAIKCPERAMACLQRIGVGTFTVDVSAYDPAAAFSPTRESTLSRQRRQRHEQTVDRLERLIPSFCSLNSEQRLDALVSMFINTPMDESDLRGLTLLWLDVNLRRFPVPEQSYLALKRFVRSYELNVDFASADRWLESALADEFSRRRKNQYLSTLEL